MSKEEALRLIKEAAETGATELDLSFQHLTELPPELFRLSNITDLILAFNQLTELPPEINQLIKLTRLSLDINNLSSLPPQIGQLINLNRLTLAGNQLSSLPAEIAQLINLQILSLVGNQLSSLPPKIVQLSKLEHPEFFLLPLTSPPYELAMQGMDAIREYFASLEEGKQTLAEVKIILVGEGASGKTSLVKQLHGERFNEHEETTHGIRIKRWQLACSCRELCCNLWDFGGQEIMHATHQFFLSRRSLYVLVLDGRRDERPEYWLRYIESFGGGSPVMVVLNKYDANPSFDLNRPFLKEKYPFIKGFWRTSCKTGNGITAFTEALREELANVRLTRNEWPVSWFRAKAKLEQMNEPRIRFEEFEAVCKEAGVPGEISRNVLLDFLHDLGIVIHFKEFALDDNHVLDPEWVTGAVYKIINAEVVAARNGLLNKHDLRELLRWQEGDKYRYERVDHQYIIELMKKFELCYELLGEELLIPQLLAVPQPQFEFDYTNALRFVLHYEDFLPPSIMPRFIVKRHHEIKGTLRWRTGVVLENALLEASAVVRADVESRRIRIAVTGTQRKAFLTVIMLTLREINAGFEGLKVSERVPMPDEPERTVDFEHLRTLLELKQQTYTPEGSKKVYKVEALLDTVDAEKMLKLLEKVPKDIGDKDSLLKVLWDKLKIEPEFMGVGGDVKGLLEDLWLRYKAKRG